MRIDAGPDFDWTEAIHICQYVINTSLQHAIKMTPYRAVFGIEPNTESVFGVEDEEAVEGRVDGVIQEENLPEYIIENSESDTQLIRKIAPKSATQHTAPLSTASKQSSPICQKAV